MHLDSHSHITGRMIYLNQSFEYYMAFVSLLTHASSIVMIGHYFMSLFASLFLALDFANNKCNIKYNEDGIAVLSFVG